MQGNPPGQWRSLFLLQVSLLAFDHMPCVVAVKIANCNYNWDPDADSKQISGMCCRDGSRNADLWPPQNLNLLKGILRIQAAKHSLEPV
jgi:hypothetical protein